MQLYMNETFFFLDSSLSSLPKRAILVGFEIITTSFQGKTNLRLCLTLLSQRYDLIVRP